MYPDHSCEWTGSRKGNSSDELRTSSVFEESDGIRHGLVLVAVLIDSPA